MKKKNYTEMAERMMAKAIKHAKDGKIDEKSVEFCNAYAKLSQTPQACDSWIKALDEVGASDACAVPFNEKKAQLLAAKDTAAAEAAMTDAHEPEETEAAPQE